MPFVPRRLLKTLLLSLTLLLATLLPPLAGSLSAAPGPFSRLDDLAQARLGAVLGTLQGAYAEQAYPAAQLVWFNNLTDLLLATRGGKVDAALIDAISATALLPNWPDMALFDDDFMRYPLGIGFRPELADLRQRFDHYLASIRADGRYDQIHQRWFIADPQTAQMPPYPVKEPAARYILGVSVADLPYVAVVNNQVVGFDIELLRSFAAAENIALQIQILDFGALIPALAAGKVDLISDGIAITEERRQRVAFSAPYAEGRGAVLVLRQRLAQNPPSAAPQPQTLPARRFADLARSKIAIFIGTVQDAFLAQHYPQAEVVRLNTTADLVLAVRTGKVDAALIEGSTARLILKKNPELAILEERLQVLPLGVAFRRDRTDLRDRFNAFLRHIREDGTYQTLYQRWCVEDADEAVMPEIPHFSGGERVLAGVAVDDLPYVSLVNGEFTGFDIELLRRFAAHEHIDLQIRAYEWDALINALAAGKVDLVTDGIAISEERAKVVAFSEPYLDLNTVALVRRDRMAAAAPPAPEPFTSEPASTVVSAVPALASLQESLRINFVVEQRWRLIVQGLGATLLISAAATLLGTLLGAAICALRLSRQPLARRFAILYIATVRGLPVLLLLMLIFYVVFASVNISPLLVAVVAFALNFAAYVAEMFRSGIEAVDRGQTEAGIALGFTRLQCFRHIVLPQAIRRILPVYRGEFISLVKMTSIVGYIGVQDLTKAGDIIRSRTFEAFFPLIMVAALYFVVIWLLGLALDHLDRKTDPQRQRLETRP
ncbi:MAG: ABC transporter permease subunit [Desulfuromonas thiophila]|nr:ABC transporter permease subunit [Desulfuromonas thiophila]